MEGLLAMSILSASPADISGSGSGSGGSGSGLGSWMMNVSVFKNNKSDTNSRDSKKQMPTSENNKDDAKQRKQQSSWFALEFDGLNCFETIVSH